MKMNADKPAIIRDNGNMSGFKNDKLHRTGDKPAIYGTMVVWYGTRMVNGTVMVINQQ